MKHTANKAVVIKETVQTTWEELGISNDFSFWKSDAESRAVQGTTAKDSAGFEDRSC